MTSDNIWAEIERRAISSVTGVRVEDDDALARVAMSEAPVNPHRGMAAGASTGGPGMMPPMMMGGAGRGGAGGGESAPAAGNVMSTGEAVASGPAVVTRGAASAGATTPAEQGNAGGGLGGVGGGGTPAPGGDLGAPSGGVPAGGPDAGAPEPAASFTSSVPGSAAPDRPAPQGRFEATTPGRIDGFALDPAALQSLISKWEDVRSRLESVDRSSREASLGLVRAPERAQQGVYDSLQTWLDGAVTETNETEARLRKAVAAYASTEQSAEADVRRELQQ